MKRWCVVCCLSLMLGLAYTKHHTAQSVFKEKQLDFISTNDYIVEKIDVQDASFTTKHLASIQTNLKIYKIDCQLSKLYQSKLSDFNSEYSFQNQSLTLGLEQLETFILNKLFLLGYKKEAERIYLNGVKISSIEVYGTSGEIDGFKQQLKKYY